MSIITIDRRALAAALKHGASIVEKSGIGVVNNVRLSVAKGRATLTFTDLALWLSTSLNADADTITATTLPAALLARTADAMEGADLRFDVPREGWATVTSGRAKVNLPILPADTFPEPDDALNDAPPIIVNGGDLARIIDAASYAAPRGIGKYAECVRLEASDGALTASATEGVRLATAFCKNQGGDADAFYIPPKAASALARLAALRASADVQIRTSERAAVFTLNEWTIRTSLIEARFPDFSKQVDERAGEPIMFDPREMERAIGRLGLVADQYSRRVQFDVEADKATLSIANPKAGEVTEEVPIAYAGEAQTLGFSVQFLRDALSKIEGDDAEMWIGATVKLAVIEARPSATSTHLIGPMNA